MNKNFYKIWLPISVVVHLVLVALLCLLPLPEHKAEAEQPDLIAVVPVPVETPAPEVHLQPSHPMLRTTPPPQEVLAPTPGVPHPRHPHGVSPTEGAYPKAGPGGNTPQPGKAHESTAPPAVMTSSSGKWPVPPGRDGGTGTMGTGLAPSGIGGAAAKGGPVEGDLKDAGELNENGVVMLGVDVEPDGGIGAVRIISSSVSADLAESAKKIVRRKDYVAARNAQGLPVRDAVKMKVTFDHGHYQLEEVK